MKMSYRLKLITLKSTFKYFVRDYFLFFDYSLKLRALNKLFRFLATLLRLHIIAVKSAVYCK